MDAINQNRRVKNGLQTTVGLLNALWMIRYTGAAWRVDGSENLDTVDAPRGMIVAANHRSFFDLYTCSAYMVNHYPHLIRRIYCPVRTKFFYSRPLGTVINLVLSGGSMWPPIFRDDRGPTFNAESLQQLAAEMTRGSLVGLHPEGRRSKDDPYTLLPPKPGLGILLEACHPETVVMPYFTLGLSNSLGEIVRRNRRPAGERGPTVSLRFGEPLRAGDIVNGRNALSATEHVMERVHDLGQADKEMRAHGGIA
jgi:1-acyl-sn-glycerol-3-phosphate acyltransferase